MTGGSRLSSAAAMRAARLLPALLAAVALAACGSDDPAPEEAATPAPEATQAPADPVPPADGGGASPFIGSISVDPGDGTMMIGTGLGLYRLGPGERRAERIEGALETPDGAGTISANLELSTSARASCSPRGTRRPVSCRRTSASSARPTRATRGSRSRASASSTGTCSSTPAGSWPARPPRAPTST